MHRRAVAKPDGRSVINLDSICVKTFDPLIWTVGNVRVTKVLEEVIPTPPADLLPASDPAVLDRHRQWLVPYFVDEEGNLARVRRAWIATTVQGSRKIEWPPIRRQRTAGTFWPPTSRSVHSQVARPSGPEKLHVISQMPGAPSMSLTRSDLGHPGFPPRRASAASHALLNGFRPRSPVPDAGTTTSRSPPAPIERTASRASPRARSDRVRTVLTWVHKPHT